MKRFALSLVLAFTGCAEGFTDPPPRIVTVPNGKADTFTSKRLEVPLSYKDALMDVSQDYCVPGACAIDLIAQSGWPVAIGSVEQIGRALQPRLGAEATCIETEAADWADAMDILKLEHLMPRLADEFGATEPRLHVVCSDVQAFGQGEIEVTLLAQQFDSVTLAIHIGEFRAPQ